jgi:hypothetical protein
LTRGELRAVRCEYARLPAFIGTQGSFQEAIAGRSPQDTVLTQASGAPWSAMRVSRALRQTCKAAKIDPPIQFG